MRPTGKRYVIRDRDPLLTAESLYTLANVGEVRQAAATPEPGHGDKDKYVQHSSPEFLMDAIP